MNPALNSIVRSNTLSPTRVANALDSLKRCETSGTNTYTGTLSPSISVYTDEMLVRVKIKNASTGNSTLNLNGLGAKKIFIDPTTQAGNTHLKDEQEYILSYDSALDSAAGGFLMIGGTGTVESVTGDGVDNTDPDNPVIDLSDYALATAAIGVQDLYIRAAAMVPRVTNGCSPLAQTEMSTSLFNILTLDFNQTTQQFAQFEIVPPRKWNNGTITFVPYWTASAGSGTVQWGVSAGAYRNDDALTVALGTAQTSDDTLIATNDLHVGPESSAITVAGMLQDANLLVLQISRNPASDTLSADAKLLGISIRFTVDAAKDA